MILSVTRNPVFDALAFDEHLNLHVGNIAREKQPPWPVKDLTYPRRWASWDARTRGGTGKRWSRDFLQKREWFCLLAEEVAMLAVTANRRVLIRPLVGT